MATSDPRGERFEARAALVPTRRHVLGMGAGAALAPLMAAAAPRAAPQSVPRVEPNADLAGLEAAVDALVQKTGVKATDPGLAVLLTKPGRILLMKGYGLADLRTRALASKWMDWQLSVLGPAITPVFWGMIRTPPEQRDHKAIDEGKVKTTAAVKMLDAQFAVTQYAAGDAFSMGDIPIAIMCYRYRELVPERPALENFERWYAAIAARPAFRDHVSSIPLT